LEGDRSGAIPKHSALHDKQSGLLLAREGGYEEHQVVVLHSALDEHLDPPPPQTQLRVATVIGVSAGKDLLLPLAHASNQPFLEIASPGVFLQTEVEGKRVRKVHVR
jgi:hypothetical protein